MKKSLPNFIQWVDIYWIVKYNLSNSLPNCEMRKIFKMDAIDVSFSSKTKYEYLINIVRGILCQNSLLFIQLDIIYQIIKHGFNITFHYEAILKIIACSYRFTTVHRQRFTGMAAVSVWTGTLGDNIQSSEGENLLNVTFLLWILHQSFLT